MAILAPRPATAQGDGIVDAAIVLAVDASASVDATEYGLQMGGIAAALTSPEVLAAIAGGRHGAIALSAVVWSADYQQVVILPWTRIATPEAAAVAAGRIVTAPRPFRQGTTALAPALKFAVGLFTKLPWPAPRLVVDVSGDGQNRSSMLIRDGKALAERSGVVVNGLPIVDAEPDLGAYYRDYVITGPGAFIIPAESYDDFAAAFLAKLLREVKGEPLVGSTAPAQRVILAGP
ncbi:MAG: DUF1194 domain-containing protein [Pseudomonadota bacterium]|nr:DUF1194 domain-containing protein [Pseudomonadota bacterium]